MKIVGLIAEYNPFHNGHLYQINKIKEIFPDCTIIVVLSAYFTQRGEISILSKAEKTDIAIHYGVDIVVELPYPFASQSADIFAHGAIEIL
ncbi:MAG: nucleotidyltransferase family protein, partial [Bacilli bacterium]|nr:nucleotidyltransferase family protein [Bacilli bacterium]